MEGAMRVAARTTRRKLTIKQSRLHPIYLIRPELCSSVGRKPRRAAYPQRPPIARLPPTRMADSPTEITSLLGRVTKRDVSEAAGQVQQTETDAPPQAKVFDHHDSNPTTPHGCCSTFHTFDDGTVCEQVHYPAACEPARKDWNTIPESLQRQLKSPHEIAATEARSSAKTTVEPTLPGEDPHSLAREGRNSLQAEPQGNLSGDSPKPHDDPHLRNISLHNPGHDNSPAAQTTPSSMSDQPPNSEADVKKSPAKQHKPLVVGRTKPQSPAMDPSAAEAKAALKEETTQNTESNTTATAPADGAANPPAGKKKEKAPKQPKPPKAAPPTAPLSPALLDLRVGHILRAIAHPNADSLYVSTIAMGDAEGADHTQVDEETGKVVRTVCSGLNGLVPLEEMQGRKVVVVANLKPVNMRSIKSAAMVLAASPAAEEGADPHAPDRVVELVSPPEGAEAGEPVYFEGWEYGEGKGPEKQLNPKKKQWEAIQPGFYTSEALVVGFNAGKSEVEGDQTGELSVAGKGKCTVKTLKGAIVR